MVGGVLAVALHAGDLGELHARFVIVRVQRQLVLQRLRIAELAGFLILFQRLANGENGRIGLLLVVETVDEAKRTVVLASEDHALRHAGKGGDVFRIGLQHGGIKRSSTAGIAGSEQFAGLHQRFGNRFRLIVAGAAPAILSMN